jgi:hypothetical protein
MRRFQDYVLDREGNAVAGAEVYVRKQSDSTLATIYSDNGVTTKANPTTTDNDGEWFFYAADDTYKFQVYVDGVQQNEETHVQHYDLSVITTAAWSILDDASVGDIRTTLGVGTGDSPQFTAINLGHATDTTLTRVSAGVVAIEGVNIVTTATNKPTESIIIACSDETSALTTGTAKVTFRMPYAFTVSAVRASVTTAPTDATLNVDINEAGVSILSTVITIDASEKTSTTAATPAVISDASLADDAEITIDIDQVGSTIAGAGLKVYLIGTRA